MSDPSHAFSPLTVALIAGACASFTGILGSVVTLWKMGHSVKSEMVTISACNTCQTAGAAREREVSKRFEDGSDKFSAIEGLLREIRADQRRASQRLNHVLTVLVLHVEIPAQVREQIMVAINQPSEAAG